MRGKKRSCEERTYCDVCLRRANRKICRISKISRVVLRYGKKSIARFATDSRDARLVRVAPRYAPDLPPTHPAHGRVTACTHTLSCGLTYIHTRVHATHTHTYLILLSSSSAQLTRARSRHRNTPSRSWSRGLYTSRNTRVHTHTHTQREPSPRPSRMYADTYSRTRARHVEHTMAAVVHPGGGI